MSLARLSESRPLTVGRQQVNELVDQHPGEHGRQEPQMQHEQERHA
jgi:hypothetical protein